MVVVVVVVVSDGAAAAEVIVGASALIPEPEILDQTLFPLLFAAVASSPKASSSSPPCLKRPMARRVRGILALAVAVIWHALRHAMQSGMGACFYHLLGSMAGKGSGSRVQGFVKASSSNEKKRSCCNRGPSSPAKTVRRGLLSAKHVVLDSYGNHHHYHHHHHHHHQCSSSSKYQRALHHHHHRQHNDYIIIIGSRISILICTGYACSLSSSASVVSSLHLHRCRQHRHFRHNQLSTPPSSQSSSASSLLEPSFSISFKTDCCFRKTQSGRNAPQHIPQP